MLTRDTQELVVSGVTFLVMGMFLGNLILIVLGLFPIVFLALGILIGQPREVVITRGGEDQKVWVDHQVEDTVTATVRGGVGLVTLSDVLPPSFQLDEGTNFKAMWKGPGVREASIGYKATCAKRGRFQLDTVSYETRHPLQITDNTLREHPAPRTYIVQPKPLFVRRIRERKAITRIPMPMEARIKFGFPTTDFLEVRDYQPGDAYRNINWKVTARRISSRPSALQVNEYEREGKKVVWIFLDSATHMALGTTVKNTMEYAVRAALGLADFYLGRECKVGLCIYDYDAHEWEGSYQRLREALDLDAAFFGVKQMEPTIEEEEVEAVPLEPRPSTWSRILFPDLGRKQQFRIMREMLNVDVRYGGESLKEAIHSCRRHIVGTLPLFIIITMIDASKTEGLFEGIRELYKYSGRLRKNPSIIAFNVQGYNIAAQREEEGMAADLLDFRNRPVYGALRRMGVTVINWNPRTQSFAQALIQQRA
ncbi:MAG: DUF58 domain-containing protein [Candidatus Bathyarchaeota archaeon]|nr:MAG: DUF58 domain-containing protein [Candidatus Bathyarchaeota archaeon]